MFDLFVANEKNNTQHLSFVHSINKPFDQKLRTANKIKLKQITLLLK